MSARDQHSAYRRAEQVRQRYQAELLEYANVIGVGVGLRSRSGAHTEEVALVVLVSKKVTSAELPAEQRIPDEIEGVPVDVQEVGAIEPQG